MLKVLGSHGIEVFFDDTRHYWSAVIVCVKVYVMLIVISREGVDTNSHTMCSHPIFD